MQRYSLGLTYDIMRTSENRIVLPNVWTYARLSIFEFLKKRNTFVNAIGIYYTKQEEKSTSA